MQNIYQPKDATDRWTRFQEVKFTSSGDKKTKKRRGEMSEAEKKGDVPPAGEASPKK